MKSLFYFIGCILGIFFCGITAGINIALLYPNPSYDSGNWKIAMGFILAFWFAIVVRAIERD